MQYNCFYSLEYSPSSYYLRLDCYYSYLRLLSLIIRSSYYRFRCCYIFSCYCFLVIYSCSFCRFCSWRCFLWRAWVKIDWKPEIRWRLVWDFRMVEVSFMKRVRLFLELCESSYFSFYFVFTWRHFVKDRSRTLNYSREMWFWL